MVTTLMNKRQLAIIFITAIFTILSPATTQAAIRPIASLMGGFANGTFNTSQNISLLAPFHDTFAASDNESTEYGGIFLGLEIPLTTHLLWQVGGSYYLTNNFYATGAIAQFADPAYTNLAFTENIQNTSVMFENRLLYAIFAQHTFYPYISLAIGRSSNAATAYSEMPLPAYAVVHPAGFSNHTLSTFGYAVGAGVDVDLNQHLRFGGGIRYSKLGPAQTGSMPGADSPGVLRFSNINVSEIYLSATFAV